MPTIRRLLVLLSLLLTLPVLAGEDYDRWYVVLLNGQRAGWSHDWQVTDADRITSSTLMSLEVSRGQDAIKFVMETEFVETLRGQPISARSSQAVGSEPTIKEFTWDGDHVSIVTTQGGRSSTRTEGAPADAWLTPAAAADFVQARMKAGAQDIEFLSIDPSTGLSPQKTTMSAFEPSTAHLLEDSVDATRCTIVSSAAPGITTRAWLDADGVAVRSEIPFGSLQLTIVLADQASAMQRGEAPELMVDTLIRPDRPIQNSRRIREASYVLAVSEQGVMPEIPSTSAQHVENLTGARVRVTVNVDDLSPAGVEDTAPYLASSTMLDATDPDLIALAERSIGRRSQTDAQKAEDLRRAVYRHIRDKTLGVGFASAGEVCRSRAGDCSEHAVLLAALLRTQGIPSRVVSGVVYADSFLGREGIFAFHMWSQALLEDHGQQRWVDLDATLSPATPFDATHIALVTATLDDNDGSSEMTAIAGLLGTLSVKIEYAK